VLKAASPFRQVHSRGIVTTALLALKSTKTGSQAYGIHSINRRKHQDLLQSLQTADAAGTDVVKHTFDSGQQFFASCWRGDTDRGRQRHGSIAALFGHAFKFVPLSIDAGRDGS